MHVPEGARQLPDPRPIPLWMTDPDLPAPCPCGQGFSEEDTMVMVIGETGLKVLMHLRCAQVRAMLDDDDE